MPACRDQNVPGVTAHQREGRPGFDRGAPFTHLAIAGGLGRDRRPGAGADDRDVVRHLAAAGFGWGWAASFPDQVRDGIYDYASRYEQRTGDGVAFCLCPACCATHCRTAGTSFSAVVTEALTGWMRGRLVDAWLAEHQATHGEFEENELRALAADAGVPSSGPAGAGDSAAEPGSRRGRADRHRSRRPTHCRPYRFGRRSGAALVTSAPVVAQAWRGSARQARLARLLAMIDVRGTHLADARAAGELLAATGTADVVDALLALLSVPGDQLLTSDPDDLSALVEERGIPVTVVSV